MVQEKVSPETSILKLSAVFVHHGQADAVAGNGIAQLCIGQIESASGNRHARVAARAFSQMGNVADGLDDAGKHGKHLLGEAARCVFGRAKAGILEV